MAVIVPAVIAAGYGIYQVAEADKKANEAKRAAALNKRPAYKINPEEYANLGLAESQAQQGLGAASLQAYKDNANRGLSTSIEGILKGGGDVGSINQSYEAYLGNMSKLAILDDQTKLANINNLVLERRRFSDERDKSFQYNQYAPYADKAASIYQMQNTAVNERNAGMAGVVQGVGGLATGVGQAYDRSKLNNNKPYNKPDSIYTNQLNAIDLSGMTPDERNLIIDLYGS